MKMGRVGDPLPQALIYFSVDGDCIWRVRLSLRRGYDPTIDPVLNDPNANAISLANLTHVQSSFGRWWGRDAMFVPQPFYRPGCNRPSCCRADEPLTAQQADD